MNIYHYISCRGSHFLIQSKEDFKKHNNIWAEVIYIYDINDLLSDAGYFNCSRIRLPTEKELADYYKIQVFK